VPALTFSANSGHQGAGVKRSQPSPIWQLRILMRQSGIVNVEVGIEDRLSLFTYESRLRLYPFAGFSLFTRLDIVFAQRKMCGL